jgi:dTDP-4-dehydrorhamnose reductase
MKVLITGSNGQLGYDLAKILRYKNIDFLATDRSTMDITNIEQVSKVIKDYFPDIVIHCAAYTYVDKAEDEKELCYSINVLGTKYISQACKEIDAKLIYISTDYVFDGKGIEPFIETDLPNPINYYGHTKYQGEMIVQSLLSKYFIVRVSWLFGSNGKNFVKTIQNLLKDREHISVVSDQFGSPTYTLDLAKILLEIIKSEEYGLYHITNEGFCSWYEFALEILNLSGRDVRIYPINSSEFPTKAKRPFNSRLSKDKVMEVFSYKLQNWKSALREYENNEKN